MLWPVFVYCFLLIYPMLCISKLKETNMVPSALLMLGASVTAKQNASNSFAGGVTITLKAKLLFFWIKA